MDLKKQIREALGLSKDEGIKLEFQAKTEDGTIVVSTATKLEKDIEISVLTEDGTTIPVPPGTYKLEDNTIFQVEKEGVVSEVTKGKKVEAAEDDEDESPAEKADWAESYEHLKDRVNNLEDAIHNIEEKMGEKGGDDVEELAVETEDTSAPKKIKTTEEVEFSKSDYEALQAENNKLKKELAEQPADAPINTNKFSSEKPPISKKDLRKMTRQERFLYNLNK